jgi:hypothetical protein
MKKEARTLTGEQDRMFASAASAKRRAELAGRDASLALYSNHRKHSGS